jgi:bifunctional UDP-N-acetylglucosamine pyrophosphorylase / glucosamine-1-phosphate N-acetyltransferase
VPGRYAIIPANVLQLPVKKTPLNVVVLAAGKGTRMRSNVPKVLHPLGGRALLDHVLSKALDLEADRIVVIYGHGGEAVRDAFAGSLASFVLQAPQLGTGHAMQQAMPHLLPGGRTLVLYGDVPLTRVETLREVVGAGELALLTAVLDDPGGYGRIVRNKSGGIVRIVEEKDATAAQKRIREINTGILCAPTDKLGRWLAGLTDRNAQREYYLTDVVGIALKDGSRVISSHPQQEWEILGINTREQLARLERIHQFENARVLMRDGVTLADPWRFDVRGELSCGEDVFVDVNCIFEGKVRLESGVRIGAGCVLRDVAVGAGSHIAPYSHLDGAIVGSNCRVGPFARLRPGTRLADDVHVGNFVEIKATELGAGSKANHLTYLGDTQVGRNVNIGAGTITCNYDGANKHRTVIEDDAFIGSDTQLVAPVTVGRGATIGAGTTVIRDAPAHELTLSRARQVSVPGWQRPTKNPRK